MVAYSTPRPLKPPETTIFRTLPGSTPTRAHPRLLIRFQVGWTSSFEPRPRRHCPEAIGVPKILDTGMATLLRVVSESFSERPGHRNGRNRKLNA